jgi:hypothetical protein
LSLDSSSKLFLASVILHEFLYTDCKEWHLFAAFVIRI